MAVLFMCSTAKIGRGGGKEGMGVCRCKQRLEAGKLGGGDADFCWVLFPLPRGSLTPANLLTQERKSLSMADPTC